MSSGFFAQSELSLFTASSSWLAEASEQPKCEACKLYKHCNSPKMLVQGNGKRGILLIGEAPGEEEDKQGTPFIGKSGRVLEDCLDDVGIDMWEDCWITNSIICHPAKNRTPTDKEIGYCRPNVMNAIERLSPTVIILLGQSAVKSLIEPLWQESVGSISRWAGWQIPYQEGNVWICPTFHPAYALYDRTGVAEIWFKRHLKNAVSHTDRPWETVPDYRKNVAIVTDPQEAADRIDEYTDAGGIVAFDYETNMLKPDSSESRIVCCSVCYDGVETICFPWVGAVVEAMHDLLRSKRIKKVASNLKYEDRWMRHHLGIRVREWYWDTMLTAHLLDNRPGISGLKFQSFVLLGQPRYDRHIEPYLRGSGSNAKNRVRQADSADLYLYCGLDSLLTYKVMEKQRNAIG